MLQLLQCVLRSRIDIRVFGLAVDEEGKLAEWPLEATGPVSRANQDRVYSERAMLHRFIREWRCPDPVGDGAMR
jgi:hypothetical protein